MHYLTDFYTLEEMIFQIFVQGTVGITICDAYRGDILYKIRGHDFVVNGKNEDKITLQLRVLLLFNLYQIQLKHAINKYLLIITESVLLIKLVIDKQNQIYFYHRLQY